jgi:uroporphyrinogen decarboxylase
VHSCGNIIPVLPDLVEIGLQALNPVQSEAMDLNALKDGFGRDLLFWGGVSTQRALPYGTRREVREEAGRVIGVMAPGGGYILGPSQQIQDDVPLGNILEFIDVARKHG